jgi:iron complex outermembrane receptor protein
MPSDLVGTGGPSAFAGAVPASGSRGVQRPRISSVTAGLSWAPPIGDTGLTALFYLDSRLQSDTNTGSDLDLEKVQDAFVVVNGRVGIYGPDKRWGVELWGQNLLNQNYFMIGADMPLQGGGTYRSTAAPASTGLAGTANQLFVGFPGEPRTYGITVRFSY